MLFNINSINVDMKLIKTGIKLFKNYIKLRIYYENNMGLSCSLHRMMLKHCQQIAGDLKIDFQVFDQREPLQVKPLLSKYLSCLGFSSMSGMPAHLSPGSGVIDLWQFVDFAPVFQWQ